MVGTEHSRVTQWHEQLKKLAKVFNVDAVKVLMNRIKR